MTAQGSSSRTTPPAVKELIRSIAFLPAAAPVAADAFISSFPRYLSADSFFRLLRREARSNADKSAGCLRLFASWVRLRSRSDFRRGSTRLRQLIDLLTELSAKKDSLVLAPRINELKLALLHGLASVKHLKVTLQRPKLGHDVPLFSYPPTAIAEQLTHVDHGLFASVPLEEFLEKKWEDKTRRSKLRELIERSNRMSDWVATYLLVQSTTLAQTKAAGLFLEVASWCLSHGNFYAVSGILSGFSQWAISRLTRMWHIKSVHKVLHQHCMFALSEDKNFAAYRAQLTEHMQLQKPCVPHVAVFLRDLTFIEDGNADFVSGIPNPKKIAMIGAIIEQIHRLQQLDYEREKGEKDEVDPMMPVMLRKRLTQLPAKPVEWLEARSKELRPMLSSADSEISLVLKTPTEFSRSDTQDNSSTDETMMLEDFEISEASSHSGGSGDAPGMGLVSSRKHL